ncbi:MAG TPA: bifunctional DNA-binding transcriptional regulator/O6-methylguanine-DNA methyltransferase Ada [Candidatus Tumulicola sp.]|jgi:AraC family transcriptional regulator of adaptative response/methylated-DNA-[protein]-cysteine methyltransferase
MMLEDDARWKRVLARDASADGTFWYSVATTKIFCRPSCPSRAANPRNVAFHASIAAARAAGFRPCRRCRPDGRSIADARATLIASICRTIERAETPPSLAELADAARLSPSYLQRTFKAVTGVSPREYAAAHRTERVRDSLQQKSSVTQAIFDAGFNSSGRFYERSTQLLGMTPARYRDGGAGETIRFAVGESQLGSVLVASSARGVVAILLGDDPEQLVRDLQDRFARATLVGGDREYERLVARVVGFVENPRIGLDLPLDVRGTAFQQRVWNALQAIPAGSSASYSEIASRIGAPKAARAVAAACAANALAVAIPCHRVVRADASAGGYAWGVHRKQMLAERERAS